VLAFALFLLGMSTFALYPIAITLACDNLASNKIVSATQMMLFCYSIGSVGGPLVANHFLSDGRGLMIFLFSVLLSTAMYLLLVSFRPQRAMA
jgi:MFS family permease